MILNAALFDTFDRCERRLALERTHEVRSISPLGLLYAAVEGSLVAADPSQGAKDAIIEITQNLDVETGELSPSSVVRHVECMSEIISLALRSRMGRAARLDPVTIGSNEWQSNLFEFRSGLHRIVLASHLDDDSLRSFAHSWRTIGELAALERSIFLTVVIVGSQKGGRRHSPWAKGYIHPIQKVLRFGRRKGSKADGFTEGWKEAWREQTNIEAETWLDRMLVDEMLDDLIVSRKVQYRGEDSRMKTARRDMITLADQMASARTDAPMRRSSCDEIGHGACGWQQFCYSPVDVRVEDLGHLYRLREG